MTQRDPKPFPRNSGGRPTCVIGYKQVVFTFSADGHVSRHLGEEDAECRPKSDEASFDPRASNYDMNFCRFLCPVPRRNKEIEKDASERLKIWERSQARLAEKIALKEGKASIAIRNGDVF